MTTEQGRESRNGIAWPVRHHFGLGVILDSENRQIARVDPLWADEFVERANSARSETGTTLGDVLEWADGIHSALGTERARKVTPKEAKIAAVILDANEQR